MFENLGVRLSLSAVISVLLLSVAGCVSPHSQKINVQQQEDISKYQTASIHVVDADTDLPLAGVKIRHAGDYLHGQRDVFPSIPPMEDAVTDSKGDARLQPLENGDIVACALNQVDSQNVFVGYYTSGKVRDGLLQLQNLIMHQHSWQQVEQSVALDPQQVPVIRISRSYGGPPDPPAQQCLRELQGLKRGMRDSDVDQLLKNHSFHQKPPATLPSAFPAASKSIDISERRAVYFSDHYPHRELHLRLRYDEENSDAQAERYRLNEWFIENLATGTRTEDANILRQARPGD